MKVLRFDLNNEWRIHKRINTTSYSQWCFPLLRPFHHGLLAILASPSRPDTNTRDGDYRMWESYCTAWSLSIQTLTEPFSRHLFDLVAWRERKTPFGEGQWQTKFQNLLHLISFVWLNCDTRYLHNNIYNWRGNHKNDRSCTHLERIFWIIWKISPKVYLGFHTPCLITCQEVHTPVKVYSNHFKKQTFKSHLLMHEIWIKGSSFYSQRFELSCGVASEKLFYSNIWHLKLGVPSAIKVFGVTIRSSLRLWNKTSMSLALWNCLKWIFKWCTIQMSPGLFQVSMFSGTPIFYFRLCW